MVDHAHLDRRLRLAMNQLLRHQHEGLHEQAARLNTLSPLGTLARGYAIVRKEGMVIRDASAAQPGDRIEARLSRGALDCVVESRRES